QPRAVSIKHLATTGDKPRLAVAFVNFTVAHRIAKTDIRSLRVLISELPRHTSRFAIHRDSEAPHNTRSAPIVQCAPFSYDLYRNSTRCADGLYVIMKIEIIVAEESCFPFLRQKH